MFGDLLLEAGAWAAGFTPAQLAFFERKMPDTRALIETVKEMQPTIEKMVPLINEAEPYVTKLLPLIDKASVEFKSVAPAIEIILDVIEKHIDQGKSQNDALDAIRAALAHFGVK